MDDGPDRSYQPQGGFLSAAELTAAIHKTIGVDEWKRLSHIEDVAQRTLSPALSQEELDIRGVGIEGARRARTRAGDIRSRKSGRARHVLK